MLVESSGTVNIPNRELSATLLSFPFCGIWKLKLMYTSSQVQANPAKEPLRACEHVRARVFVPTKTIKKLRRPQQRREVGSEAQRENNTVAEISSISRFDVSNKATRKRSHG